MSLIREVSKEIETVFVRMGLDKDLGLVTYSDRPDLSDFQCNGAMRATKILKKNPREIAEDIKEQCANIAMIDSISVDGPGFLNFKISNEHLLRKLSTHKIVSISQNQEKIIVDYGGPNVAKPLHVGHLRAAIIGESIKRIARNLGHKVIGDVHLGDWGTPMGMLLAELEERHPTWPYFQKPYIETEEAKTPPFSSTELNKLYPEASKHSKEDKEFAEKARQATAMLQDGDAGYRALWRHFLSLSIATIKQDYAKLDVDFDLWLGESDADIYIEDMVQDLIDRNIAEKSNGAIIIRVAQDDDSHDIPPLMLKKSDGASTYATTDLATIFQRVKDYNPDRIIYVVDKRQSLHFVQVFRAAALAGYISEDKLDHVGFGTMNGKDGKPFKTRDGGVMQLSNFIDMAKEKAIEETGFTSDEMTDEIEAMTDAIAIASIKYADLGNPPVNDYIFDPKEFVKFEGDTGPYNQYQLVRCLSVLEKVTGVTPKVDTSVSISDFERNLILQLLKFDEVVNSALEKRTPSEICSYMYDVSKAFSAFYKNCHITTESDVAKKETLVVITKITADTLAKSMELLAIPTPKKMLRANKPNLG